jgi:conjugal transfer pilus assembly protein TraE
MNIDLHTADRESLKRLNMVLGLTTLLLAAALLLVFVSLSGKKERVVIVPPGLSGPVSVDWGRADAEYMKSFALFYATLIGTINPRNVEYVADRLSAMTSPEAYINVRRTLLSLAKDPLFSNGGAVTNFVSNEVIYESESGLIFVLGANQTQTGYGQPKIAPVVYELNVGIVEGRPVVRSVSNYPGTQAHTLEWKAANPNWKPDAK